MIDNQKIAQAFVAPRRKGLVIGATSVAVAGALLGVGVAGASASTVQPTPVAAHSSTSAQGHSGSVSVVEQLRASLFAGAISGSKAQALATRLIADPAIFSALPAALQGDLTALKTASPADAVGQAEHITSTALAGGYGQQVENLATSLQSTAGYPISHKLVRELRTDIAKGTTAATTGTMIARTIGDDPKLLATLPANLRADVTALQKASPSDAAAQVTKIEASAASGDYGQQIQQLSQTIAALTAGSTK
jgi:hypothetical protein